jgi:hypothetical protein
MYLNSLNAPAAMLILQEDDIQKAIFVGNYEGAVDTCLKVGRLADALLVANIGGPELFKRTMQRYMRRNPRPYMAVSAQDASLMGPCMAADRAVARLWVASRAVVQLCCQRSHAH